MTYVAHLKPYNNTHSTVTRATQPVITPLTRENHTICNKTAAGNNQLNNRRLHLTIELGVNVGCIQFNSIILNDICIVLNTVNTVTDTPPSLTIVTTVTTTEYPMDVYRTRAVLCRGDEL